MRILVFLSLFSVSCYAEKLELTVGKDHYFLESKEDRYILLEKDCWERKAACEAFRALSKVPWESFKPRESLSGGKNPSSIFCREAHGGKVAIARDQRNNAYSLCLFKDKSVATADSLIYSARKLKSK